MAHDEHGDGERQRDGRRADGGDAAVPEEDEQHDDRERGADQHRVPHRPHGFAHQLGLIVHRLEVHAGRQRGATVSIDPGYTVGEPSVLPPTCRVTLISAAGLPSPAMIRT